MNPQRSSVSHTRRPAFTLVELLVTIGIIGLLMSILLPVLSRVREQANMVRCASNLRTLAQAWQLYTNANHGTCVPGRLPTKGAPGGVYDIGMDREYRPRWYELLGEQIKQIPNEHPRTQQDDSWTIRNRLFLCPAVPDWINSRNYPYGYNFQFLGDAHPKQTGKGFVNYPVKAARIRLSTTVMAADSLGTAAGKPKSARTGYYVDGSHDPSAIGNKGWCLDPPRMNANSDFSDEQHRSPQDRSGPDPRHQRRANVVFCDGHVELMTPADMGYIVGPGEALALAGKTNLYFSGSGRDDDAPVFKD